MFDSYLRNLKDRVGQPLVRRMPRLNPIIISLIGFGFGLGAAVLAIFGLYFWALVLWLLNRLMDGLDGLVARIQAQHSDLGGYLDFILDVIVYAALPMAIVMGDGRIEGWAWLSIMLAIFYVNIGSWLYLSSIMEKRALHGLDILTTIIMPPGLIGGFETILFYSAFLIFPGYMHILFIIFSVLVLFTIIQRLIWAVKNLA